MRIPTCPNHAKSSLICEQSRLRLLGENDVAFQFTCACCGLLWAVTKDRTKQAARWENQVRRVREASDVERERAARKVYSFGRAG